MKDDLIKKPRGAGGKKKQKAHLLRTLGCLGVFRSWGQKELKIKKGGEKNLGWGETGITMGFRTQG